MSKRHTLGVSKWLPSTKDKITFEITLRPSTPDISKHLCICVYVFYREYVWGHHVLWGCVGLPWACEDVCDCGLCVKTVELVRIITAYLQMHLPWFLPNAQTRWLLTTMITHTTRNIAATKYWIRPIFFKTDHALPSEAWMMMKCQWKYQNCRSLQRHVFFV